MTAAVDRAIERIVFHFRHMPGVTFQHTAPYEEVWTTPLIHLGEKYRLSDNGIRKVCKALNIPLPKQGHWAKVAAGHQIPRPVLPSEAERTTS